MKATRHTLRKLVVQYPPHLALVDLRPLTKSVSDVFGGIDITASMDARKRLVTFVPRTELEQHEAFTARVKETCELIFPGDVKIGFKGLDGDQFDSFTITYSKYARRPLAYPKARASNAVVMQATLGRPLRFDWDTGNDKVTVRPRPKMPTRVTHDVSTWPDAIDTHEKYQKMLVPVGVDENGDTVCWQPSVVPHGIFAGGTGTGKTSLLHTVCVFVSRYFPVMVLDGKNTEFTCFRGWPNVEFIANGAEQQAWLIAELHRRMKLRNTQISSELGDFTEEELEEFGGEELRQRGVKASDLRAVQREDLEPLFVIIDEFASFKDALLAWWQTIKVKNVDPAQPPVLNDFADLARLARTAKIHMIIGIQRPDAQLMAGEARSNLEFRVSVGDLDPDGAKMMWGDFFTGTMVNNQKRPLGRGVAGKGMQGPAGEPREFQAFYTPKPGSDLSDEDSALLESMKAPINRFPRKILLPPQPKAGDDGVILPYTWADLKQADLVDADSDEGKRFRIQQAIRSAATTEGEARVPFTSGADGGEFPEEDVPDHEDHFVDAMEDWPKEVVHADAIEPGDLILFDGRPCDVIDVDQSDADEVKIRIASADGDEYYGFERDESVERVTEPNREQAEANAKRAWERLFSDDA